MEFTGRVAADAQTNTLTDGRQVTNFTLVANDRYTTKAGERRDVATFIRCAYWVSPKVADFLKKGAIISVFGRIGMDVYNNAAGEAQGTLTCHVNHITFIAKTPRKVAVQSEAAPAQATKDDLPF